MFCSRCGRQFAANRAYCLDCGIKLGRSISTSSFRAKSTARVGMVLEGRFQLVGLIGKGASSRVYLADDVVEKRPVAVKLFSSDALGGKERFLGEARAFLAVRHPNVLRLFHVGDHKGVPFLVLELLKGETLGDYLRREGRPQASLTLDLLRQAAAGLAAAHAAGLVHRDVKPDNLFLIGDVGDPFGLKVIDFGLAGGAARSGTSTPGLVVGTLAYIAPEQVLSERVDARSDVYALGAVLYRCLTGKLPFDARDDADLVAEHLFATPAAAGLDSKIARVVGSALRKAPDNRYETMLAMRDDLERLVGLRHGEPEGAPLARLPDVYAPKSAAARAALVALRARYEASLR